MGEESGGLGDLVHKALKATGVHDLSEQIHQWLGVPCGCEERRAKLNQLSRWAARVVGGKSEKASHYLKVMMGIGGNGDDEAGDGQLPGHGSAGESHGDAP